MLRGLCHRRDTANKRLKNNGTAAPPWPVTHAPTYPRFLYPPLALFFYYILPSSWSNNCALVFPLHTSPPAIRHPQIQQGHANRRLQTRNEVDCDWYRETVGGVGIPFTSTFPDLAYPPVAYVPLLRPAEYRLLFLLSLKHPTRYILARKNNVDKRRI